MMPPAGVVIPETSQDMNHCGTTAPGWIRGSHPAEEGEQVEVEVCFNVFGNGCDSSENILVTHWGQYFVYFLKQVPFCYLRYCTADTLYQT